MLTEEERQAIVTYRLEKAENALKQVEANIANEFWDLIANRLYYAAYYAVTALLISENHERLTSTQWKNSNSCSTSLWHQNSKQK